MIKAIVKVKHPARGLRAISLPPLSLPRLVATTPSLLPTEIHAPYSQLLYPTCGEGGGGKDGKGESEGTEFEGKN